MYLVRCLVLALLHLVWWHVSVSTCPKKPCLFEPCQEITGCLVPIDPYVFFGHNLTLNCTLLNSNQSADLYFYWKNDVNISAEYQRDISPETVQLNMPISTVDKVENGTMVNCVNPYETGTRRKQHYTVWLEVEYFPRKVTDWTAVVNNWDNLTLTLEPGRYIHRCHVVISVQWQTADSEIVRNCSSLSVSEFLLDSSLYNHSSYYNFTITVRNTKKNVETVTAITLESDHYVKPAPVTTIEVSNETSRCVTLHWEHGMETSKSLLYQVLVKHNTTQVSNTTYDQSMAKICDLRPNMMYTFTFTVKSTQGGYWSEAVFVSSTTLEDRPDHGANVTAGDYYATECNSRNERNVTIYLKPPSKEYQNGKLNNYVITYVGQYGTSNITRHTPISHVSYLVTALHCDVDYSVYLSVSNSVGSSPSSKLQIPKVGHVLPPKDVQVAVNGSSVKVLWKDASHVWPRSWTVFWCRELSESGTCFEPLSWLIVDGKLNSSHVPVSSEDFTSSYMFGVSMTTDAGSSGMTKHSCIYDVNQGPDNSIKPSILAVESVPNLSLTARWSLPVCKDGVLVTRYVIQYCSDNKTHECVNESVSSDHSEHIIPNLVEGINYSVRLQQVAASGRKGDFSDPKFGVPKDVYLKVGVIAGIVIAGVFVLAFLMLFTRCVHGKWKEREDIKMPHIFQENPKTDSHPPQLPEKQVGLTQTDEVARISSDSGQGTDQSGSNHQHMTNSQNGCTSLCEQTQSVDVHTDGACNSGVTDVTLLSSHHLSVAFSTSHNEDTASKVEENSSGFLNEGYDQDTDSQPYVIAGAVSEQARAGLGETAGVSAKNCDQGKDDDVTSVPGVKEHKEEHEEEQPDLSMNDDPYQLHIKAVHQQEEETGTSPSNYKSNKSDNTVDTPQSEHGENPKDILC